MLNLCGGNPTTLYLRKTFPMKRLIIISMIAIMPLIAACHTIQGAGKDVTAVGKGMESAAKN